MPNKIKSGSDATAARKLARSEPMSGRTTRGDETPRRSNSIERLKPGSDPSRQIDRLYAEGRRYPLGEPAKSQSRPAISRDPMLSASPEDGVAGNFARPQMPEDQPARNYYSDASGWVRGCNSGSPQMRNETAEGKPGFDHSLPRNKMRR